MSDFRKYLNVYSSVVKLLGSNEEVEIRPIVTGQLKRLLPYENETDPAIIEDALDKLILGSIVTPEFDINKLYLQDRFYLLVELRKISRGKEYQVRYTCPECKSQIMVNIDLGALEITRYEYKDGLLKLDDNISIKIDHPRRGEQKEALYSVKRKKGLGETEKLAEITWQTQARTIKAIITPEGEVENITLEDKMYLINNLPQNLYEIMTKWYDDNDFGIKLEHETKCRHCDWSEKTEIPLDSFFF